MHELLRLRCVMRSALPSPGLRYSLSRRTARRKSFDLSNMWCGCGERLIKKKNRGSLRTEISCISPPPLGCLSSSVFSFSLTFQRRDSQSPRRGVRTLAGLALRTPLSHGPGLDFVGSTFQRGNEVTPLLVAQVRNRWWQRQAAPARLHTRVPSKRNAVYCDVKKKKKRESSTTAHDLHFPVDWCRRPYNSSLICSLFPWSSHYVRAMEFLLVVGVPWTRFDRDQVKNPDASCVVHIYWCSCCAKYSGRIIAISPSATLDHPSDVNTGFVLARTR